MSLRTQRIVYIIAFVAGFVVFPIVSSRLGQWSVVACVIFAVMIWGVTGLTQCLFAKKDYNTTPKQRIIGMIVSIITIEIIAIIFAVTIA